MDFEQLADGTKKHADNPKIAASLNETEIRTTKATLEDLRETYTQTETAARQAYDAFAFALKDSKKMSGNAARMVKGALDRQSESLKDFCIAPEKRRHQRRFLLRLPLNNNTV